MASRFWVGGTGTWDASDTTHWAASSNGAGGQSVPVAADDVTFDASSGGGTITPNYDFTVTSITMGAFTGTLDFSANNNSPTMVTFSPGGSGIRTLNMGSGTFTLTGTGNVWNITTATNLTLTTNSTVFNLTGAGAAWIGGGSGISYGTSTLNYTGGGLCTLNSTTSPGLNVNFTGTVSAGNSLQSNGTQTIGVFTVIGSSAGNPVVLKSGAAGTTRVYIFQNGSFTNVSWVDLSITMNGAGNTWTLNEALNLTATGANTTNITLINGTFVTNNLPTTSGTFALGAGTKVFTPGSSTITLTGTGTAWNSSSNGAGFTISPNTATLKLTNGSASSKTVSGTILVANLWLTGGGTGIFIIGVNTATRTFTNIQVDPALTVQFFAGSTTNATSLTWSGTAGNLNTFKSTTDTTAWTINCPSPVNLDYVSLQDSTGAGNVPFYAGTHSTDATGNTNWLFSSSPSGTGKSFGRSTITNTISI